MVHKKKGRGDEGRVVVVVVQCYKRFATHCKLKERKTKSLPNIIISKMIKTE